MVRTKIMIVTDVGEFEAPADIARRFRKAKKRLAGRLDRRTKEGKALLALEAEFARQKRDEWIAAS